MSVYAIEVALVELQSVDDNFVFNIMHDTGLHVRHAGETLGTT